MKVKIVFGILLLGFMNPQVYCQEEEWKKYKLKDESLTITSRITETTDEANNKIQIIEYEAVKITSVPLDKCVAAIADVPSHKKIFSNTEVSEIVEKVSEDEVVIYYYFNPPWPVPKSDCVSKMKKSESKGGKTVVFESTSNPELYEQKDVKRMTINDATYQIQEIENGMTRVSIFSRFSPVVSAPKWIINAWFPKGPARVMESLVEIARQKE